MADAASPFDALDAIKGPITQVMVLEELRRWDSLPAEQRSLEVLADSIGLRLGIDDEGGTSWGTRFGPWATFGSDWAWAAGSRYRARPTAAWARTEEGPLSTTSRP